MDTFIAFTVFAILKEPAKTTWASSGLLRRGILITRLDGVFWNVVKRAIKDVFKESVQIAVDLDPAWLVFAAIKGTKIVVDVSRSSTLHNSELKKAVAVIDEITEELTQRIEQNDDVS